jgi:hypothetical protein
MVTPPLLEKRLQKSRSEHLPGIDFIYFSASHTHSGIGGWESSLGGQMMTGRFNERILSYLESKTIECIKDAGINLKESQLNYFDAAANKYRPESSGSTIPGRRNDQGH